MRGICTYTVEPDKYQEHEMLLEKKPITNLLLKVFIWRWTRKKLNTNHEWCYSEGKIGRRNFWKELKKDIKRNTKKWKGT